MNDHEITKYIKQVRTLLPLYSRNEKRYLQEFTDSIKEFCASNPSITIGDLVSHYGTPADIVHDYIESYDTTMLIQRISLRSTIRRFFTVVLILLTIALLVFTGFAYKNYLNVKNTIVTHTETIISDS